VWGQPLLLRRSRLLRLCRRAMQANQAPHGRRPRLPPTRLLRLLLHQRGWLLVLLWLLPCWRRGQHV